MRIRQARSRSETDLVFRQEYLNPATLTAGGVVAGASAPVIDHELVVSAAHAVRHEHASLGGWGQWTIRLWIRGDYSAGTLTIIDTQATNRTRVWFEGGVLRCQIQGGATIDLAAYAAWSVEYLADAWNLLEIQGDDGSNQVQAWLNSTLVGSTTGTAWAKGGLVRPLVVGNAYTLAEVTAKRIRRVEVWRQRLTPAWSPLDLLEGATGLWADLDAGMVRNTQPVNSDWNMEAVGTASWLPINSTASKVSPGYSGGQCLRNVCTAANGYVQTIGAGGIPGNRYLARSRNAGDGGTGVPGIRIMNASGAIGVASTAWQQLIAEDTAVSTQIAFYCYGPIGSYAQHDDLEAWNLSLSGVTCKGNLGSIAMATPASMTWGSHPDAPTSTPLNGRAMMYSDGVADYMAGSLAASAYAFHKAAGFTYFEVIRPDAAAAGTSLFLVDTCRGSSAFVGITVWYHANLQRLYMTVTNGVAYVVTSAALNVLRGSVYRVAVTWSEAAGAKIFINDLPAVSTANTASATAANAFAPLTVGKDAGGFSSYFHGSRSGPFLRIGAVSDAEVANWLAWSKWRYAL